MIAEDEQRPDHQADARRDQEAASRCDGEHGSAGDRHRLDDERGEQAGDEAVEEARLGQREAEPLQLGDLVAHLGLAGDRLDRLAEDDADADAGADGAEAAADAEADRLAGLGDFFGRRPPGAVMRAMCTTIDSFSVVFGDRAAEVDSGEGGKDERLQGGDQADLER